MEILYCYNEEPGVWVSLMLFMLGALLLIAYFLSTDGYESAGRWLHILLAVGLIGLGLVGMLRAKPTTYVFARIKSTESYAKIAKNYEYIDNQGDIFKLKVVDDK